MVNPSLYPSTSLHQPPCKCPQPPFAGKNKYCSLGQSRLPTAISLCILSFCTSSCGDLLPRHGATVNSRFQPLPNLSGVIHLLLLFFPSICTHLGEGFSQLVHSRQINQTTPKRCLWGYYILCYNSAVLSCTSELLPWYMHRRQLVLVPHACHETFPCQVAPCKVERGLSTKLTRTVSGTTLRTVVSSQLTGLPH